jgi:hypothetical protein
LTPVPPGATTPMPVMATLRIPSPRSDSPMVGPLCGTASRQGLETHSGPRGTGWTRARARLEKAGRRWRPMDRFGRYPTVEERWNPPSSSWAQGPPE